MNNAQILNGGGISHQDTATLKGLFAIMVLLSHLQANTRILNIPGIATVLTSFGYLGVAGFMFLSGYGMYYGYKHKGKNYSDNYVVRKIAPFYSIIVLLIVIYSVRDLVFSYGFVTRDFIQSFFWGKTIIDKGWYLQVQLLFYWVCVLSFSLESRFGIHIISTHIFVSLLYYICCFVFGVSSTWYETVILFSVGMIMCQYYGDIIRCRTAIPIFVVTFLLGNTSLLPDVFRVLSKTISAVAFVIICINVMEIIQIRTANWKLLGTVGKYSLEIYVVQGFFLKLFRRTINIENDILYIIVVCACTGILAILVHPLFRRIYSLFQKR